MPVEQELTQEKAGDPADPGPAQRAGSPLDWLWTKRSKVTWKTAPLTIGIGLLFYFAEPQLWSVLAGAALVLPGLLLRFWAAGHLAKNERLVTSGPYRYVKNPLYIGTLLILAGCCLAARNGYAFGIGLAIFVLYYAPYKTRVESERLRRLFGAEFDQWDRAVPGYFPRLSPYRGTRDRRLAGFENWSWSLVKQNEEHLTGLGGLLAYLVVVARLWW